MSERQSYHPDTQTIRREGAEYSPPLLQFAEGARTRPEETLTDIQGLVGKPEAKKHGDNLAALSLSLGDERSAGQLQQQQERKGTKTGERRFWKMVLEEGARLIDAALQWGIKQLKRTATGERATRLSQALALSLATLGSAEMAGCASTQIPRAEAQQTIAAQLKTEGDYLQKEVEFARDWDGVAAKEAKLDQAMTEWNTKEGALTTALEKFVSSLGTTQEEDAIERLKTAIREADTAKTALHTAQTAYETEMAAKYPSGTPDAARVKMQKAHDDRVNLEGLKAKKEETLDAVKKATQPGEDPLNPSTKTAEYTAARAAYDAADAAYTAAGGDTALGDAKSAFVAADEEVTQFQERSAAKGAIDTTRADGNRRKGESDTASSDLSPALEGLLRTKKEEAAAEAALGNLTIELDRARAEARGLDGQVDRLTRLILQAEQDKLNYTQLIARERTPIDKQAMQKRADNAGQERDRLQAELDVIQNKLAALRGLESRVRQEGAALKTGPEKTRTARDAARRSAEQLQEKHKAHTSAARDYDARRREWSDRYGVGAARAKVEALRASMQRP